MATSKTVYILIVGSGMGGATSAAGLASTGARILILERGARLRDSAEARDARAIFQRGVFRPGETWLDGAGQPFNPGNYYYVGGNSKLYGAVVLRYRAQDFEPIVYRDGATPGWPFSYDGSSINAQLYTRGNAKDYDAWASEAGAVGWSYREVLPYFKRSEDNQKLHNAYHSYGGPLGVSYPINPPPISYAFLRAAQELGIPFNDDFNGAIQDGISHYQLSTRNAERSSASTAFVKPVEGRKNLTVRLNAQTLKIEVQNGRAIGVTVVSGTGTETLNADREIIVSCGAIGSPRLLQLSGIGPADALKAAGVTVVHDLPGVGSNMQDHLDLYAISECTGEHTYDRVSRPHRTAWAGLQYFAFKTGPVTSTLFEIGGFWYADKQARSPDIQFHLGLGSGIEAGGAAMKNPGVTLNSAFLVLVLAGLCGSPAPIRKRLLSSIRITGPILTTANAQSRA